ncbi:MAG: response regulator [Cyanobacteria bacterium P01_E01_bin.42]
MNDRPKILAVDDTPANLEILMEVLSSVGYMVSTVTSGDRALRWLQKKVPALILLDIQMPGIDGFETCRQIKANPETANIPIIFITALSDTESIIKGFSLGAVDYITKPFREVELLARVKTHINLHLFSRQLAEQVQDRTSKLQIARKQLTQSQLQMIQSEKMASLGNLVAGVAHEINNPIGFLNGSMPNGRSYMSDLFEYIELYQKYYPDAADEIIEKAEDIDLEFLTQDFPKLFDSMEEAIDRIKSISTGLRNFSRVDTEKKAYANLHDGIESALLILKYRLKANQYRPAIHIIKEYGNFPAIECFPGQLNQVFMNILANAIDAFDEVAEESSFEKIGENPQHIQIKTESQDGKIKVCIADNGKGMSAAIKDKIFDQGFTTKKIGKGTGLGMAIAHQIVTEKHGGAIACHSELGKGVEFIIILPCS